MEKGIEEMFEQKTKNRNLWRDNKTIQWAEGCCQFAKAIETVKIAEGFHKIILSLWGTAGSSPVMENVNSNPFGTVFIGESLGCQVAAIILKICLVSENFSLLQLFTFPS